MDLQNLSRLEKMELAQTLWDDVAKEQTYYGITNEHKLLLDNRLEKLKSDNCKLKTWEEIKQKYSS
ncbi:MAG: addiction module protein [Dysgonamonadaceae bacterium]|jgi:putative addiction module component (TIGR02574 family)|nr:addiction module protein [Dysgonamonadaceae bacterium]